MLLFSSREICNVRCFHPAIRKMPRKKNVEHVLIISLNYDNKKSSSFGADINQVIIHHMCLSFPINYVRFKCKFFLQSSWSSSINIIQSVLVWRRKYHIELNIIILIPFANTRGNFRGFVVIFIFMRKLFIYTWIVKGKHERMFAYRRFLFSSFLPVSVNLPTKREKINSRNTIRRKPYDIYFHIAKLLN